MPAGTNLRMGLAGFGEGIARGMRFKTANQERLLWHREALRRRKEEEDQDEERYLRRLATQMILSEKLANKRDKMNRLNSWIQELHQIGPGHEGYEEEVNAMGLLRRGLEDGTIDIKDLDEMPEHYVDFRSGILKEVANEQLRRWEWEHRDKGDDDTPEGYFTFTDAWTGKQKTLTEKELDKGLSRYKILLQQDMDSGEKSKIVNQVLNMVTATKFDSRDKAEAYGKLPAGYADAFRNITGYNVVEDKESAREKKPVIRSFNDQLAEVETPSAETTPSLRQNVEAVSPAEERPIDIDSYFGQLWQNYLSKKEPLEAPRDSTIPIFAAAETGKVAPEILKGREKDLEHNFKYQYGKQDYWVQDWVDKLSEKEKTKVVNRVEKGNENLTDIYDEKNPTGPSFNVKLTNLDKNTKNTYDTLDDEDKKFIQEKVKEGYDLALTIKIVKQESK